ncbi:VWA domain-containing protein [Aquimarina sp. AD1]|uniref:vWA domain-containing protein n=1 Tax=Aquimarina sp. (strain AD1) TaxID=1714848 RepID=UPI000E551166|nr:VWA domain-containing protein [Aquimarina sp. AD1]AXT57465.1 VWA domain-containing protein [Aquimarina sp. AD1]RKN22966.1 VWA domain-containing protein [Aquimarina sp. AD1]
MYLLEEKIYFWLLLVIPIVIVLFLGVLIWKKTAQKKFADKELLKRLSPNQSIFKSILKIVVISLAFACFIIALVNPKVGTKLETVKREGVDVVFAIDVSKSMLAEDIAPNRIEKTKQLVTQIINNLASDRVGIIAYAASAFPQLPITTDYGSAKMFLQSMNTDMLSSQGTAINEAIELAKTYYDDEEQTNRVLFIISDGEDHEGNVASIAEEAAKEGIKIFTIGVGTTKGGPIPIKRNGIVQSYKKNSQGETVITKLNTTILQEIANEANGTYIDGSSTNAVVENVTELLQGMDKKEFEAKQFADFKDQFQWFLGAGLLLLFLDIFLLERKTSWVKRLNLFNEE